MAYSVLIVEDNDWFRESFASAVRGSSTLELVGTATDLEPARALLDTLEPDVLIVDLGLPSGNGIELVRHAKKVAPHCDSIVVSVFGDDDCVLRCIQAGASGYLLKDATEVDIEQQIHLLRNGGSPVSPAIARRLLALLARTPPAPNDNEPEPVLSKQETAVLTLSSKGYNQEEIARLLELSKYSVGTYVKRAYRKLQVHSATEACHEARRLGLFAD